MSGIVSVEVPLGNAEAEGKALASRPPVRQNARLRRMEPMLVCLCKVVSERQVLSAILAGADTVAEIERRTQAGSDCGACREKIAEILEATARAKPAEEERSPACNAKIPRSSKS